MDHSFFGQWELTALDHYSTPVALGRDLDQSPSSESYTSYPSSHPQASAVRPNKAIKTSSWKSCATEQNSAPEASCPRILSFGNPESPICQYGSHAAATGKTKEETDGSIPKGSKRNYDTMFGDGTKSGNTGVRSASHNQEHIMAERKRREKLSQRFIELSAIVPGLKKLTKSRFMSPALGKMDKASVLSDAIKYLKQLQENVKALEDQVAKRNVDSAVLTEEDFSMTAKDIVKKLNSAFREFM
ncbi:hypothetical protein GW17_00038402 [Ensete ventricosum]|nr:hypothetical protein GW17_00038402 [Ensete ventricosum]